MNSDELELNFAETDTAINRVLPWRDSIPLKVFASQIRFQIRLDDIRDIVRGNTTTVDEVLEFYNQIIDALLDQYSLEFKVVSGSGTWKQMIVYKNILRAIDNIGINSAYVSKYYIQGILKDGIHNYFYAKDPLFSCSGCPSPCKSDILSGQGSAWARNFHD